MSTKYVLVALPLSKDEKQAFASAAPGWGFVFCEPGEVGRVKVSAADIIIGNVEPALLQDAYHLEWLQLATSGADKYQRPGVLPEKVILTSATGAYGQAVSEHMLALILSCMKKLPYYRDNQVAGLWRDEGTVESMDGAHVLVLGTGDIGRHFARLAAALGASVRGIRRHVEEGQDIAPFEKVTTMDSLHGQLGWADVVLCCLPSTQETRGLVDKEFFSQMKRGAIFANCGRGDLVVNADLALALMGGRISWACLEVTDPEPLPKDSALWSLRNCVITPHVAGNFHLPQTRDRVVSICLDNFRRYVAGKPLRNVRHQWHDKLQESSSSEGTIVEVSR